MSILQRMIFHNEVIFSDLNFLSDEFDTSIATIQPIPLIENDHEEFLLSGIERNIQIPQEGQLRCNECTFLPRCRFDSETEVLVF